MQAITESEHYIATQTVLDSELRRALKDKDVAEARVIELEGSLKGLQREKEDLLVVATERSGAMRHAEVGF